MRCECSECTRMCDPEIMSHCEGCDSYFCPNCFDEHDSKGCIRDAACDMERYPG